MKKRGDLVKRAISGSEERQPWYWAMMDLLFTQMFKNLVYPQIWEDPDVDISALGMKDGDHVVCIASGGCNVLNYISAADVRVTAVDLNSAHIALNRLKHTAIRHMPSYESFYRFFGYANEGGNKHAYRTYLGPNLDAESRAYWEGRTLQGRRYHLFTRNFYRFGMLGKQIGMVHALCRLYRMRPERIATAKTADEQRWLFDNTIGTLFNHGWVRWLCGLPVSIYALGIPPAQYKELKAAGNGDMSRVLYERLERLACGHDATTNYFAWQAFGRAYDHETRQAVPRYLKPESFDALRARIDNIDLEQTDLTSRIARIDDESVDGFVFLDAQDWMKTDQLNDLWTEVTRAAKPGTRVAFRTGGHDSILTSRLKPEIESRWTYLRDLSQSLHASDRSSIYGGFHVYEKTA